jgi:hypothetical protein
MTLPRPQRLTPPARPGELLKRFDAPARPRKVELDNDPAYLALVRDLPCLYCGVEPCGEAAHLRMASAAHGKSSGLGRKPADRWALPLCPSDHRIARHAQHNRSEAAFWDAIGIDAPQVATLLYAQRGDLVAMRAVIFVTIAQRTAK